MYKKKRDEESTSKIQEVKRTKKCNVVKKILEFSGVFGLGYMILLSECLIAIEWA